MFLVGLEYLEFLVGLVLPVGLEFYIS